MASKPCECKMYGAVCEELVVITCMNDFDGRAFGFEYRIQMPLVASLNKHAVTTAVSWKFHLI